MRKFYGLRSQLNIDFLSTLKGALTLLRNPEKTESVYDIEDGLRNTKATQAAIEFVQKDPAVASLIAERYQPPPLDLDFLAQLPPDSLGYTYARYIRDAGFDPNFYRPIEVVDDASYVLLRMRQTHDIWHIVAGFKTDVAGELGLKSFELAQTRRTMAAVLVCGGLLKTLFNTPDQLDEVLDRLASGYRTGMNAQPLLAQKWEENWERSLTEWRELLNIPQRDS
jgi:ubiquinone biosynthesis protein COQ4